MFSFENDVTVRKIGCFFIIHQKCTRLCAKKIGENLLCFTANDTTLRDMPSSKCRDADVVCGHNIFSVFEPMHVFPPRTAAGADPMAAAANSVVTTSSSAENLESGQLLLEAVNTALSELSVKFSHEDPVVIDDRVNTCSTPVLFHGCGSYHIPTAPVPHHHTHTPLACGKGSRSVVAVAREFSQPIPILFPLGWSKQSGTGGGKKRSGDGSSTGGRSLCSRSGSSGGGGVNHLNLIQIMGRTAHAWQPYLYQDPYRLGRSAVMRPTLNSAELNWIIISHETEEPKKTR